MKEVSLKIHKKLILVGRSTTVLVLKYIRTLLFWGRFFKAEF